MQKYVLVVQRPLVNYTHQSPSSGEAALYMGDKVQR